MSRMPTAAASTPQRGVARPVSRPHDTAEREADRAAEVVAAGGHVRGWSLTANPPAAVGAPTSVQRQGTGGQGEDEKEKEEDPNRKEYEEAAKKTGEALLETKAGKALKERILESPEVKKLESFATSPAGIAIGATAVAGGVTGLALAGKELPFQPPAIPLDGIHPGLSAQVNVKGPLNAPTFVGLTITFEPEGPEPRKREPTPTPEPLVPRRSTAEEARLSEAAIDYAVQQMTKRHPLGIPVMELNLSPRAGEERREEQTPAPVQRSPESASADAPEPVGAHVDEGFSGPGRPLAPAVRRVMETRFGHDFSSVRLHDDARAVAAARAVDASAFTVGDDIVAGPGHDLEASPRLLAHELAHVVQQQRAGRQHGPQPVRRDTPAGGATLTEPTTGDYSDFVDMAIEHLRASAEHWRTIARLADAPGPSATPAGGERAEGPAGGETTERTGTEAPERHATPPPTRRLEPERLRTILRGLLDTYEGSRRIIEQDLGGDVARQQRLQDAYVAAVQAARAAAASSARVNLVLIAAPKEVGDAFITNATAYASLYFSRSEPGDTVQQVTEIDSPDELFDAVEAAAPDRMMRRIDIFAHGTIEPTHQIRFGATWYTVSQIEAAAARRARTGASLQSQTRFDGSTVIELHACRLGAPTSTPDSPATTPTSGTDFLTSFGRSVGGSRGQEVVGYEQRWVPRRFEIPGVDSTADVGTTGPRARAFDDMAVRVWDAAMAGGVEAQSQLTDAERQPGAVLTRARKVEIMRHLYDAAGGAWLIGHQYSGAQPQSTDPARDVRRARDTFSNEADWTHRVLRVTVPTPTGGTP